MTDEDGDYIIFDYGRVVFYGRFEECALTGWWLYRAPDGRLVKDCPYGD